MDSTILIIALLIVGLVGLVLAILINVLSNFLYVKVDETEAAIRECLPGNNCGACGYSGCDGYAAAIAHEDAPINSCPVGGAAVADAIGEITGKGAGESTKMVAFVKCSGNVNNAADKYIYSGTKSCVQAMSVPGSGSKLCENACLGLGSCVSVCDFDAIRVCNGVAVVDKDVCVACGKCAKTCPKHIIDMVPYAAPIRVACANTSKGKAVMEACKVGCIGCMLCTKQCEFDAIHVENNIAIIDYEKCTKCGKCAEKCPRKIITINN